MANVEKVIILSDGTATNLIDPITKASINYKPVSFDYNGNPMTDAIVDGNLYIKSIENIYYKKVIDKEGELFLEKDTMIQMKSLSSYEILLLKAKVLKGVRLHGYHEKKDTPAPIEYYLSSTTELDDGGAVIQVGTIKLVHNFNYNVDLRYYGVKGEGTEETIQIQRAFNRATGGNILIHKPKTEFLSGQIRFPISINLKAAPGVKWKAIDTLDQSPDGMQSLFKLIDVLDSFIDFNDADLYMNKSAYSSEHNHIFHLDSCDNVVINNVLARDSGGDGVYITGLAARVTTVERGTRNHSSNITLNRFKARGNRRNGFSGVGGYNIVCNDCEFDSSSGTTIQGGADIEPEARNDRNNRYYFNRCKFRGNAGKGFTAALQNQTNEMSDNNLEIVLTDCYSEGNQFGFSTQFNREKITGSIQYIRCMSKGEFYNSYTEVSSCRKLSKIYTECYSIDTNTSGDTRAQYSLASAWYVHYSATLEKPGSVINTDLGGSYLYGCVAIDTREVPKIRRGFATSNLPESITPEYSWVFPKEILLKNFTSRGHSIEPIYIAEGTEDVKIEYSQDSVINIAGSGNSNIVAGQSGSIISNLGATGSKGYILPTASKNLEFTFRVDQETPISVVPKSGSFILGQMRTTSSLVSSAKIGDIITIKGTESGNWNVTFINGVWSNFNGWTTAQRPISPKTAQIGYNTTLGNLEYYNGTVWVPSAPLATTLTAGVVKQATFIEEISMANAIDPATTMALTNEIKSKVNEIVTKLKTSTAISNL